MHLQNVPLRSSTCFFKCIWEWQQLSGDIVNPPSMHAADRLYVSWSLNVFFLGMGKHCIYKYKKKKSTESPVCLFVFPTECKYTLKSFWWIWYLKNVQKATLFEMLQVLIFAYLYWGYEPFLLTNHCRDLALFSKKLFIVKNKKKDKASYVNVCKIEIQKKSSLMSFSDSHSYITRKTTISTYP